MRLFAVIPTIGERNETLAPMIQTLTADGVDVILVYNRSTWSGMFDHSFFYDEKGSLSAIAHLWGDDPVNLSKIWNMGLDRAEELSGGDEFTVAVFNDDLTLPPGLVQEFADALQREGSSAVYAQPWSDLPNMTNHVPWHLGNRMVGYAFALRGWDNLRADEDFLWWYGDSDLDWRARSRRGVCAIGVPALVHHDPNGYTNRRPELAEQAGRDRETFMRKHGFLPW